VDPGAGEIRETPRQHADRIARPFGFRDLLLGEVCRRPAALARRTGRCLAPPCRRGEREVELPVGTGQTSEPVVVNKLGDVGLAVGCVVGDAIGAEVKMAFIPMFYATLSSLLRKRAAPPPPLLELLMWQLR
jgi:hypothetical protein